MSERPPSSVIETMRRYYGDDEGYDAADNSRKCYELAIDTMRAKLESFRKEVIGDCTLYLGDCERLLSLLPRFDAVVTDPPYGINADLGAGKSADKWSAVTGSDRWDAERPSAKLLDQMIGMARYAIVWGGNYFSLPPTSCWLVWDKQTAGITTFADCEVAWTNLTKAMRLTRHLWSGPYMKVREERYHPTQKPLDVMRWAIEHVPEPNRSILDPFMGSGTTGVAAVRLGRKFTGIEREPKYFDIACRRISEAYKQGDFFVERPKPQKAEQLTLPESS